MTYSSSEYSTQDGDPVFRFVFTIGATEYAYTTEPYMVSDSNRTYTPAPIKTSAINQTNEMAKDPLKLEFPRDNTFAALFLGGVPEQAITVTVLRGHVGDTDEEFQFYWKGRVSGTSASGDTVSIECENIFTSLRRTGVRARYQKKCRHALYQRGCNLSDYDFAVVTTVTAVDGVTVTVPDLVDSNFDSNSQNDGYFTGGMIETASGVLRYIVEHSGTQLTMITPLSELTEDVNDSSGDAAVTLYPGCDHTRMTCKNKFDNLVNFGGFPWIPSKNPFGNSVSGSIV